MINYTDINKEEQYLRFDDQTEEHEKKARNLLECFP